MKNITTIFNTAEEGVAFPTILINGQEWTTAQQLCRQVGINLRSLYLNIDHQENPDNHPKRRKEVNYRIERMLIDGIRLYRAIYE